MGESFGLSTNNASNTVLPQPTPALLAEDDDEPPSSGPRINRSTQMTGGQNGASASEFVDIGVQEKDFAKVDHFKVETLPSDHNKSAPAAWDDNAPVGITTADLEKLDADDGQRVRSRRFRVLKLSKIDRLRALFTLSQPSGPRPSYRASLMATLRYTPLNLLLLFIPVSWAFHYTHQSPTLIFIFSGLGIVPLAALLGLGTEQVALSTSQSVGGLLNASLGNLIEMIISGIALKQVCHPLFLLFTWIRIDVFLAVRTRSCPKHVARRPLE